MRVLVVGSCGKKKLYSSSKEPGCQDISGSDSIRHWKQKLSSLCVPVRDMYTGPQNSELVKAVDLLRTIPSVKVQLNIISAGFGLLEEGELVPPYDCSFTTMKMAEVRTRSKELKLHASFAHLLESEFDFVYLALGKRYLVALGNDVPSLLKKPTVSFHELKSDCVIRIPCAAETVKAFSKCGHKIHGVVGFKGDLLRVLVQYSLGRPNPENEVRKWRSAKYLRRLIFRLGGLELSQG